MIARFLDWLFPPVVCGTNTRLRRLLDGHAPRYSVRPEDVERRWLALRTPTAVEKLQADVDQAVAAAERQMHEDWERRR